MMFLVAVGIAAMGWGVEEAQSHTQRERREKEREREKREKERKRERERRGWDSNPSQSLKLPPPNLRRGVFFTSYHRGVF
jgi:Flp pilus assembly protein TadB